ncbi:hypothetical protein J4050_04015 [Winogradskyella sp. DF17]|uniref:DUF975 family protein n=1 Tax=Winogradskyella pelagia TaxID=2819984 RepID=A0ABS3SZI7_9FLAO|nr:hypothetical protein [Winogradskyella sp. DF17]MBO3115897.1 hypothetical protein [Winogradskyella sp. DF17]
MTVSEIQQRIQNAKPLDFSSIFNQAIELFKKIWVQGLITVILNMVLVIPVMMVIYIPLIFMGVLDAYSVNSIDEYGYDNYNEPELSPIVMLIMFVVYIFAVAAVSTITMALRAAFYRICKMKDFDEMGKEDYFYFLKKKYLAKSLKLALASMGIALLAALLCFLPLIYAIVPLSYVYVVYAFNPDKSISEILRLSFDLGNKKWLLTLGLLFICGLLAGIVGFVLCFIGIYVTQSFSYLGPYLIYKDVVGFEDEDMTPRIEEHSSM